MRVNSSRCFYIYCAGARVLGWDLVGVPRPDSFTCDLFLLQSYLLTTTTVWEQPCIYLSCLKFPFALLFGKMGISIKAILTFLKILFILFL